MITYRGVAKEKVFEARRARVSCEVQQVLEGAVIGQAHSLSGGAQVRVGGLHSRKVNGAPSRICEIYFEDTTGLRERSKTCLVLTCVVGVVHTYDKRERQTDHAFV